MRRFIQVLTLLVMILGGSLPVAYLAGAPEPDPCCAGMTGPACPCRMPSRPSGPTAPCGPGQTVPAAPAALLAAPCVALQTDEASRPAEPRPAPPVLWARADNGRAASGPTQLARPGPGWPAEPPGRRQARLSVFRI